MELSNINENGKVEERKLSKKEYPKNKETWIKKNLLLITTLAGVVIGLIAGLYTELLYSLFLEQNVTIFHFHRNIFATV